MSLGRAAILKISATRCSEQFLKLFGTQPKRLRRFCRHGVLCEKGMADRGAGMIQRRSHADPLPTPPLTSPESS